MLSRPVGGDKPNHDPSPWGFPLEVSRALRRVAEEYNRAVQIVIKAARVPETVYAMLRSASTPAPTGPTADPGPVPPPAPPPTPTPATMTSTTAPTATSPPTPSTPPTPAKILIRWRDIVEALPLRETMPRSAYEERRRRLAYLNQRYGGPIQSGRKGSQPRVDLAELLGWWNTLTIQAQHAIDRERDAAATLLDQHNYGRAGRVAPSIAGSIKSRRQKKGN